MSPGGASGAADTMGRYSWARKDVIARFTQFNVLVVFRYPLGIMKEHLHCRAQAGIFDVSHMVPVRVTGKDRAAFMEKVTVADVKVIYSKVQRFI